MQQEWQFGGFYKRRAKNFSNDEKENIQKYAGLFLDYIFNFLPTPEKSWKIERGESFLENIKSCELGKTSIGFDIKYYQLNYIPDIKSLLIERNVKIIHLQRRNKLRHYISRNVNQKQKEFGINAHGSKEITHPKIKFKMQDFTEAVIITTAMTKLSQKSFRMILTF